MIKVNYTELDGPAGPTCRLEASGHAGYAPAGQDIVCAGASTLMQTLCALLAGEEGTRSGVWDEPDGPRLAVTAAAPQSVGGGGVRICERQALLCWQNATRTMSASPI